MTPTPLQWAGDLSVAETRRDEMAYDHPSAASMGAATFQSQRPSSRGSQPPAARPSLQWGRDLSVAETYDVTISPPSSLTLQWGRDLSVAETVTATWRTSDGSPRLQWGRDLSVAETGPLGGDVFSDSRRFNGAATFQSQRRRGEDTYISQASMLQWGRDLSVAETP